jgi:geranylgeranylglycerol-phosphate geranylgeranyltransferase|tara:strand:+ start:4451 stop:5278 length:828 start_codon:yes stop_codon:yes gene_type:complete
MIPFIEILRPHNCLIAAIAVIVGATIASEESLDLTILLPGIIAFLICGAGNTINDFFDFNIDKINNPARPLPSKRMSLRFAYFYSIFLFAVGVGLSIFINIYAIIIASVNSFLLYIYPMKVKKYGGICKNILVSYLVASPFLFGGVVVGEPTVVLLLVLIAGLANTSREIIKDIQDHEGDKAFISTLPSSIGITNSAKLASLILLITILISPLPYILNILNLNYIFLVIFSDIIFFFASINLLQNPKQNAKKTQKLIKIGMVIGLTAFLIGDFHF